jgi:cation:H+ antiporter
VSDPLLGLGFLAGVAVSLAASWLLVVRVERVGVRLGASEALLGLLAALGANAPEITAAVTAMVGHQSQIGAGVVIGSNVFNLAALLGFAALTAGEIRLHRRVIVLEGVVAIWLAAICVLVVVGVLAAPLALALALVVLLPYAALLGLPHHRLARLRLPAGWARWLTRAIREEELELEEAIHPGRGGPADAWLAAAAVVVVVGASIGMEQAAARLGERLAIPQAILGGLILAAVTSLPNAVAAVYLAARGRGAATLSTAMNSNALNVTVGFLLPAAILGIATWSGQTTLVASWYAGLSVVALVAGFASRGLRRAHGALIICAYAAFVGVLAATA